MSSVVIIVIVMFVDCDVSDESSNLSKREAQVGGLKLDLPLDEDDYLMPSPQQSQTATTYMDLIGDTKLPGKHNTIM